MLISIADYARQRGCTYQGVSAAIRSGRISLIDGKIDPLVADIQWEQNRRRAPNVVATTPPLVQAPNDAAEPPLELPSMEHSRRRRELYEADLAEMRARQRSGELVELAQVHLAYTTLAAQLRAALERIPDKIAPRLAAETDEHAIHTLLLAELDQAMLDMATTAEQLPARLVATS